MKEKDILYVILKKNILVSRANYSSFAATMVFQPYLDEFKSFVPPFVLDFMFHELKFATYPLISLIPNFIPFLLSFT